MGEESIRQDKELARAAIKGLAAYAEQIAHQGKDDEIRQVRSLVDALSLYWGVDEKRDWTGEFDERVQQARQRGSIPQRRSSMFRIKAVNGLCRYAEEMASAQGVEEIERILELPDVIRRMGKAWEMCQSDIENACRKIEDIVKSLQAARQTEGIHMQYRGSGIDSKQRINKFNRENAPFYIVDHENGKYSLCLAFSFLEGEYEHFGQDAFDRYALEIGDPVMDDLGLFTHGNGYEWQTVFEKVFEGDPEGGRIQYDCEAGGFFCYAESLPLLEDLGSRFRAVCMDGEKFAEIVSMALKEAAEAAQSQTMQM